MDIPPRIDLARTPTPLQYLPHLSKAWGGPHLWVKRDDLTGFGLSGNKVRKLEFHMAAALDSGADTVITVGAVQSNHCRATALAASQLGLRCVLLLRTADGSAPATIVGNHKLHRLSGAEIVFVNPEQYQRRDQLMAERAARELEDGHLAWVIPEGASDVLGMFGMAAGFSELVDDITSVHGPVVAVWHASSSAGTTAGFGWAASSTGPDISIVAASVGDPIEQLSARVQALWEDGVRTYGGEVPTIDIEYRGDFIGEGYGRIDPQQGPIVDEATRLTGLLFDPTYTGKALYGLYQEVQTGRFHPDDHVVFWHTGGGFEALAG